VAIAEIATTESHRAGGLAKGAKVRAARARAAVVDRIVDGMDAEEIAPAAYRLVMSTMCKLEDELPDVPITSALDAVRIAQAMEIAHKIGRLASGQSTSNVAHATMSDEERRERMAQLANMAQRDTTPPA
jgi:hypothetical protein